METIKATDSLVIELHPSEGPDDDAQLAIKALDAEPGGEPQPVIVCLSEVPALCDALMEAAALLAAGEINDHEEVDSDWFDG